MCDIFIALLYTPLLVHYSMCAVYFNEAVYRTAPATPGLLIIVVQYSKQQCSLVQCCAMQKGELQ